MPSAQPTSDLARRSASGSAREPVFQVRGLARVYGEGSAAVTALRGVDFELFPGEMIVLLGGKPVFVDI